MAASYKSVAAINTVVIISISDTFSANIFRMINFFKISLIIQKIDVVLPLQSIGVVFYFLNFSTSKLN